MTASITWHSHACFQLNTEECNILIDPFFTGNAKATKSFKDIEKPDLVLVTHLHHDHVGDTVSICKATGAMLGTVVGAAMELKERGVPSEQIINSIGFNIGGSITKNGIRIVMTEATHSLDAGTCVGYILILPNGYTIYHAGDTGIFAGMELLGKLYSIDLALLPIGDVFTMGGEQAAYAAQLLKAKNVIPMHFGTFPAIDQTADIFLDELRKYAPKCPPCVLEPGQTTLLP